MSDFSRHHPVGAQMVSHFRDHADGRSHLERINPVDTFVPVRSVAAVTEAIVFSPAVPDIATDERDPVKEVDALIVSAEAMPPAAEEAEPAIV